MSDTGRSVASATPLMRTIVDGLYMGLHNTAAPNVQFYTTCQSPNCTAYNVSPANSWSTGSSLGTHEYTALTSAGGGTTGCDMSTTFWANNQPIVMHVTSCKPVWKMTGNPEVNWHLAPTTITLYIPPAMWNAVCVSAAPDCTGPAGLAVGAWNTALGARGMALQVVSSDCGSGGNCITMQSGTVSGGCAETVAGSPDWTTGEILSSSVITLDSSYTGASADMLQRTIAHELGHLLGLNDFTKNTQTGCLLSNSVMAVPVTSCTNASGLVLSPTQNDTMPSFFSTYGDRVRTVCGYPQ